MNREKVKTPLEGLGGPYFPRIIDDLNTICDELQLNSATLEEMAKGLISPFFDFERKEDKPTTKDGYAWL